MISRDKLPKNDFTVDDIVKLGYERKEVVITLQKMQDEGKGRFIVGRRGAPSRFQYGAAPLHVVEAPAPPEPTFKLKLRSETKKEEKVEPEIKQEEEPAPPIKNKTNKERDPFLVARDLRESIGDDKQLTVLSGEEVLKTIAAIIGFKGIPTLTAVKEYLDKQTQENNKFKEGAVWNEPPGIEKVPVEWISEIKLDNGMQQIGWSLWTAEQREAIAKELRTWRKVK